MEFLTFINYFRIIILKSSPAKGTLHRKLSTDDYSRAATLAYDSTLKPQPADDGTLTSSSPAIRPPTPQPTKPGVDLCILTGHVSTMGDEE